MLIKCEECGNSISDEAPSCPHCGIRRVTKTEKAIKDKEESILRKQAESQRKKTTITNFATIVAIIFLAVLFIKYRAESSDYATSSQATDMPQTTTAEGKITKTDIAPFNITQICAATVSVLFYKPVNIMRASYISSDIAQIEYTRASDGTWWRSQCRLTKNTVEWRAMGSTSEPNKEGRWRTEYWVDGVNINGDSVVFYAIDRKLKKLFITEKHDLTKLEITNIPSYIPNKFDHSFKLSKLKQFR